MAHLHYDNHSCGQLASNTTISTTAKIVTEKKKKKTVRFSTIEIIEFPYTFLLGETTKCIDQHQGAAVSSHRRGGHPKLILTTEWCCQKRTTLNLDFFEQYRPKRRTSLRNLMLSRSKPSSIEPYNVAGGTKHNSRNTLTFKDRAVTAAKEDDEEEAFSVEPSSSHVSSLTTKSSTSSRHLPRSKIRRRKSICYPYMNGSLSSTYHRHRQHPYYNHGGQAVAAVVKK